MIRSAFSKLRTPTVGPGVSVVDYPRLERIPELPRCRQAILEGTHALPVQTLQTTPLVTSVRPYVPGDDYKKIHWKSSARQIGELQVKEFDLEQTADCLDRPRLQRRSIAATHRGESTIEHGHRVAAAISRQAISEDRADRLTVQPPRMPFLPADRGGRQHQKIVRLHWRPVEADGAAPLVETLISTVGRLRRGMTAVVITPSLDPSWVRPLASLRTRGVACVVVTFDIGAYDQAARESAAAVSGPQELVAPAEAEAAAKRARALRHALAEYELPSYLVTPGRPLGEILAR